jgi:hypothetical protein
MSYRSRLVIPFDGLGRAARNGEFFPVGFCALLLKEGPLFL